MDATQRPIMTAPSRIHEVQDELRQAPRQWLVTGGAGFIGSHIIDRLVSLGQRVRVVDNLATGHLRNIAHHGDRIEFIHGDITDEHACGRFVAGCDVVLHQAALGSVPRSIEHPLATHRANVDGFIHMLTAAEQAKVGRFVYASSSSVYGDEPTLPKREDRIGNPVSPYAASKRINEVYADVFQRTYGITCVGLRYFNVFGARQDPNGPYAAVIPRWVSAMMQGAACTIHGDGLTSRDFCYVDNAVQANLLAAMAPVTSTGRAYNVACGAQTTLLELFGMLQDALVQGSPTLVRQSPIHTTTRAGDVRHSLADVSLAAELLGYVPTHDVAAGIRLAVSAFVAAAHK
jgi:UDP-N-acetylglucosamine/UDP-N-acetylgalactosamine 4-epimerase